VWDFLYIWRRTWVEEEGWLLIYAGKGLFPFTGTDDVSSRQGDMKRNGNRTSNLVRFWRSRELCRSTVLHTHTHTEREREKKKKTKDIYHICIGMRRNKKDVSLDAHSELRGWTEKHSSPIDSCSPSSSSSGFYVRFACTTTSPLFSPS
jgi:hypothetical protein